MKDVILELDLSFTLIIHMTLRGYLYYFNHQTIQNKNHLTLIFDLKFKRIFQPIYMSFTSCIFQIGNRSHLQRACSHIYQTRRASHFYLFLRLVQINLIFPDNVHVLFLSCKHKIVYFRLKPTISFEMPVPSQGHYGFHSFPVVD